MRCGRQDSGKPEAQYLTNGAALEGSSRGPNFFIPALEIVHPTTEGVLYEHLLCGPASSILIQFRPFAHQALLSPGRNG